MAKGLLCLPANFKVKCFGPRCNVNRIGKYVPPYSRSRTTKLEVVSETRLEESALRPTPHDVPTSDTAVESVEKLYQTVMSGSGATKCRWQWSARFTRVEGEFDGVSNLMGVVCSICTRINGRKKVIVSKGDNMEKHEGKKVYKVDGVSYPGLEVGNFYTKKDCKHVKNQALWSACQSAPKVIQ